MAKNQTDSSAANEAEKRLKAAEKRAKDAEKKAKEYASLAEKGLSAESLKQVAGKHADPEMVKKMQQLQKMASNENANVGDMIGMAADLGGKAGLSDKQQELLKAVSGGLSDELDVDKASQVPGLVVNKETGKVSVLGLLSLDAKDPTSKMIANGIAAGYNMLAVNANEIGFKKAYELASKGAAKFDLTRASNHRIGTAAATALIAGTSFWPDINNVIQQEKQGRKDLGALANRFAPLLDDYMPGRASRVAKLYQVNPETNQMIVNERKRLGMNQNADRFRNALDVFGRVPLFAVSLMRGQEELSALKKDAEHKADLAGKKIAEETPEQTKLRVIKEQADIYEKELGLERKDAVQMAREETSGKSAKEAGNKEPESFWEKMNRDIVNGGVIAAPPIVSMVARNLYNKRLGDLDVQKISAADMVEHLGKQLDDNPKEERFTLPKDMSVLGSKTGNNQIKLEDYVEQVFRQHERDTNGSDAVIPARYNEQLQDACKQVATALREGKLDGRLALFKLVGEQQIVRAGGKYVADADIVKDQLDKLETEMLHMEFVDREAYFAESSFTPQELKQSWNGMDEQEREVFSLMVPAQVLESVGVRHDELRAMREKRQEHFQQDLSKISESLLKMGDDKLHKLGATKSETSLFHEMAKQAEKDSDNSKDNAEDKGKTAPAMSRTRMHEASHAVANLLVAANTQHDGFVHARGAGISRR